MPIIDGEIVRSRYSSLKLNEVSSVDNPAQPGAIASIVKRLDAPVAKTQPSILAISVAKYIDEDDGAHTFTEVLRANLFDEKIWPMTSALSQAIRSTVGDSTLSQADRESKVTQSVDEFLAAVRDLDPTAEKRLAALITKKETAVMKTVEQLTAEVSALTTKLATAESDLATAKTALTAAEQKAKDAEGAKETATKALAEATDETLKIDDNTTVKKSIVGADQFAVFKALDDRAQTATLEKRAGDELGHVVGTVAEKALVLKARAAMPEAAQKALDAILASAEKMASGAFVKLGGNGPIDADAAKAAQTFTIKVAEIQKRDNIPEFQAMTKARTEFPAEFEAYQASGAAA